ncbi:hypothetical protein EUA93_04740 [Nocardioides oleivorans]|uniref:Protein CR006 P-loop domain-containing protein n=1 Tax=Nocardioides oleivorans TaxID=273676 RepID=A0A4Q2S0A4_9ACTN|nr:AAA family ATPase [Nocardioides oleivorans]RYB93724.1 hypothetical protein EUA93_04740 [Nocardioides oleivorans]
MSDDTGTGAASDPRHSLAEWANSNDEWVRQIVRVVLATGAPLDSDTLDSVYALFRQEKSLDERVLPAEPRLETGASSDDGEEPLVVTKLSDVHGVNAIAPGSVIEPHVGLTVLYGENGTGKTGYSRIFKTLAASRTADPILGNVDTEADEPISATIEYRVGTDAHVLKWKGESGKSPFSRMSIFDTRAVNIHVDDDIEYVYTPAVLSLFEYVIGGLRGVQERIDGKIRDLQSGSLSQLLARFPRDSTVYPFIETLGASSDLVELKERASVSIKVDDEIEALRATVAALQANTLDLQISSRQGAVRALREADVASQTWNGFDASKRIELLAQMEQYETDYREFRAALFASAALPTEPEETWEGFVRAGARYRLHLEQQDVHDDERCLYCRQALDAKARDLIERYQQYLEDKISADLAGTRDELRGLEAPLGAVQLGAITSFLAEHDDDAEPPPYLADLKAVLSNDTEIQASIDQGTALPADPDLDTRTTRIADALAELTAELASLRQQAGNRSETLSTRQRELSELIAAAELAKSWTAIENRVMDAKQADRLATLAKAVPTLLRSVTGLAKDASNELINNSFEELFHEECASLRAKELKLQFVGREGKAQRRKMIGGRHKPSRVFSEGEQKVLAIADFLAEARLAGIAAPVIFDDPVSSLDHRRINEVAERIARLAAETQVIVFTHDILFTTKLLSLFEKSKRCTYLHVSDEDGAKGKINQGSGPRWHSLSKLRGQINEAIQRAGAESGQAREAHISVAYSLIRSWCEVFIEQEVLQGVTQRLQPNVSMGGLSRIKLDALPDCFETVNGVFEDACRYTEAHSQPLATLGVAPTLDGLKQDWDTLTECKKKHDQA